MLTRVKFGKIFQLAGAARSCTDKGDVFTARTAPLCPDRTDRAQLQLPAPSRAQLAARMIVAHPRTYNSGPARPVTPARKRPPYRRGRVVVVIFTSKIVNNLFTKKT